MAPINSTPSFLLPAPIATRRLRKPMCCATASSSSSIPGPVDSSGAASEVEKKPAFEVGQRVRVARSIIMYHMSGKRNQPVDVQGMEGTVTKDVSYKDGVEMSANCPFIVSFDDPPRFRAHFSENELEAI